MSPGKAIRAGNVNGVKLVLDVGATEFNGGMYWNVPGRNLVVPTDGTQFSALMQQQFGSDTRRVAELYSPAAFGGPKRYFLAYRDAMADAFSVCPVLSAAREVPGNVALWVDVDDNFNAPPVPGARYARVPLGAPHSGTDWLVHAVPGTLDANQRVLQRTILTFFVQFAKTGDPNGEGGSRWRRAADPGTPVMVLRPSGMSGSVPAKRVAAAHHCGFWRHYHLVRRSANLFGKDMQKTSAASRSHTAGGFLAK